MRASLGRMPRLVGLVVVGSAPRVGGLENALRAEVVMLVAGSCLFLLGRRFEKSG